MLYQCFGIELFPAAETTATLIGGVTQQQVTTGTTDIQEATAGQPFAEALTINAITPVCTFMTYDLKKAADKIPLVGKVIAPDTGKPGLSFWELAVDDSGQVAAGAVHRKVTIPNGLIYPTRWTVDHQGEAMAEYTIAARWDRTNDPIIVAESQPLPTGLLAQDRWSLGKMSFNSIDLQLVKSFSIDTGNSLIQEGGNSDHFPTDLKMNSTLPRITVNSLDVAKFAGAGGIPLVGTKAEHANTTMYLRKRVRGIGQYVADGTPEHIKFTASGSAYWTDALTATGNERGEGNLTLAADFDGTNEPIVIDTASTIT